jgi:hypothetical protein
VFVKLEGTFPDTAVPTQAVTIDQRGCIHVPRVVGLRVGHTLPVRNSDNLQVDFKFPGTGQTPTRKKSVRPHAKGHGQEPRRCKNPVESSLRSASGWIAEEPT